jgi:urea transport system permease protein
MVVAVAVGGRSSLTGVVIGTLLVNFGKDTISSAIPSLWQFVMGVLFIAIVTILPRGLVSIPSVALRIKTMLFKPSAHRAIQEPNA